MSANKRVLHVFSSFEVGGSQRRFATYISHTNTDCEHMVYAMDGCYDAAKLVQNSKLSIANNINITKGNTRQAIKQIKQYLKTETPDLLVTYNWGATEWVMANAFSKICPVIHIQDGFGEDEQNTEKLTRRLMRMFAYRQCNTVVVPSKTLERIARRNWFLPEGKVRYIPNGIDIDRFICPEDIGFARSIGIDPDKPVIGIVAALRPEKNVGRLIEAFSKVEDEIDGAQLVIVGSGIGTSAMKMLAERVCKPGRVIFAGNMANPEKLLPSFDVFALSSDTEQMPLSVIEAMACALPIVSTDVGDISHMVSGQNAPYISGNNAESLADNLIQMLGSHEVSIRIGAANQAKAKEQFSLKTMIDTYDDLFTHHGKLAQD
ncbi:glycosyltransferase family 4 protein [Kordiimonas laminariae]|uniref:glycosyltransferase family 4 protein n=1 Tax=Kordiimonas laminariae TaxID=2917717 RepID=UPI001FF5240E|nr:glycosyltransferase family 4 protein [Kordiimonas laminariae]